jgi:hypothetical protein
MIGEKGAFTDQARIMDGMSKYDCFFLFQMDFTALQEDQFKLPEILTPPDSNFFQEVCMIFFINE